MGRPGGRRVVVGMSTQVALDALLGVGLLFHECACFGPQKDDVAIVLRAEASALMGNKRPTPRSASRATCVGMPTTTRRPPGATDSYKRMQLSAPLERKLSAVFLAHPW